MLTQSLQLPLLIAIVIVAATISALAGLLGGWFNGHVGAKHFS